MIVTRVLRTTNPCRQAPAGQLGLALPGGLSVNWSTAALIAAAAAALFLIYRSLFSSRAHERRQKLTAALRRYKTERSRIVSQYPRI